MNEVDLRGALVEAARRVPEPDLALHAWRGGQRRGRLRAVGVVGGVVAVTGVVVLAVALAFPSEPTPPVATPPSATATASSPSDTVDAKLAALLTAVRRMPVLSDRSNAPTYIRDGRLWYGPYDMMEGVPGTVREQDVVAGNKTGWVVQLRQPEVVAGRLGPMGGDFEPFPDQDTSNPNVFAASPDGKYIAMGATLLDGEGNRIGALPMADVAATEAWTPEGLVYTDTSGRWHLWDVGSVNSVPLPPLDEVNTDGWTIATRNGCSVVGELLGTGEVDAVFTHCGEPIATLSPAWAPGPQLAVTADGQVYDSGTGKRVQTFDLPEGLADLRDSVHLEYGGWWRGNSANDVAPIAFMSFTIDLTDIYDDVELDHRYEAIIIGCLVTTGECGQQFRRQSHDAAVPFIWR